MTYLTQAHVPVFYKGGNIITQCVNNVTLLLKALGLDEAGHLLDMGFRKDIDEIIGVLWAVGDITTQYITHNAAAKKQLSLTLTEADTKFMIGWRRVVVTSMFGIGFVGLVLHFWYEGLDKFINHKLQLILKTSQSVATKVTMDDLIFGLIHLFVFFTYMELSVGKTIPKVKEVLKMNYFPTLVLENGVWPSMQIFDFQYVPIKYQILYLNLFCLLESAFLSWLEKQKDAPWKQWFQPFHSSNGKSTLTSIICFRII